MTNRRQSVNVKKLKRRRRRRTYKIVSIVLEILVLLAILGVVFLWKYGTPAWMEAFGSPVVKSLDISDIDSTYGCLMQFNGEKVIGEKSGEEIAFPASLTKIMTTIVAIEKLPDLNHEITLTDEMVGDLYQQNATQAGFQAGEAVRVIDLLYGAMLPSGADCCRALSCEIAGSEADFAELMNQKAEKLGLKNTHFCDSTGLHDPNHYSTAHDMAIILKYAWSNETFRKIASSQWHASSGTNIHPDGITYYNTIFKGIPDTSVVGGEILGGKTGFTSQAGLCLASVAEIEGREYIFVSMGAWYDGQNYSDAKLVYNRLGTAYQELK